MPADRRSLDPDGAEEEAIRLLGPLEERRIPVFHLDEIAAAARALEAAWAQVAPAELVARLRSGSARLLAPGILEDEGSLLLLISAPAAVCLAFDERAGRLDSHTEFGR